MNSDLAISANHLTKAYRIFGHPGDRIKQALMLGRIRFHREFTALQDVSFEIRRGETVGIIGRNGSGKSTLLQLICGILKPTSGSVTVKGRISALLELGAGFNPEFTGRENAYFQGALMGLSKDEMARRFDHIAAFADIGEFIDQPVRTYSSGMFVRLAFSVAIHVDPEILVIDEALAVGDEAFQRKCMEYIDKTIADKHTTVLLVSHNILQVERFCQRAIWLEEGHVRLQGSATSVCNAYHAKANEKLFNELSTRSVPRKVRKSEDFELLEFCLEDENGKPEAEVPYGKKASVLCRFSCTRPLSSPAFGIGVHTPDSLYLATENSASAFGGQTLQPGVHVLRCALDLSRLLPNTYALRLGISAGIGEVLFYGENLYVFRVSGAEIRGGEYGKEGYFDLRPSWSIDSVQDGCTRTDTSQRD